MRKFTIIADETHEILRELVQTTQLLQNTKVKPVRAIYDVTDIGKRIPDLYFFITFPEGYSSSPDDKKDFLELSPEERQEKAKKRDYFDATLIDPRCFGTKRLKFNRNPQPPSILSAELLNYGVGALRRKFDDDDLDHRIMREKMGFILSENLNVHEIPSQYFNLSTKRSQPETWQSTNLVYGDSHGELMQILQRRDNSALMNSILRQLNSVDQENIQDYYYHKFLPVPVPVINEHLTRQAQWTNPPRTKKELIQRIEFILSNSYIDRSPATVYESPNGSVQKSQPIITDAQDSRSKPSGYDGWLQNPFVG